MADRARAIAMARRLRALGPIRQPRRGGRLVRQQQPDAIRLEYFKAIRHVVERAHAHVARIAPDLVHQLQELRRQQGKHDVVKSAPPPTGHAEADRARDLVGRAAAQFAGDFRANELHAVALQFGKRTSDFQREQLDRQVRQAMGVPFSAIDRPTQDRLHIFASSNVELIKTIPDRYFDRVIRDVSRAFVGGTHPETMAQQIADAYDVGINDAMRIARDQVGKLAAQVNQDRQEAIGLTGFIWRGAMDNRERDSHRALEGQHFDWDDLPIDEETGEEISPGSAIQCRCYAEPDFSTLTSRSAPEPDDAGAGDEEGGRGAGDDFEEQESAAPTPAPAPLPEWLQPFPAVEPPPPADLVVVQPAVPGPRGEPIPPPPAELHEAIVRDRARALAGTFRDVDLGGRTPDQVATAPRPLLPDQAPPTLKEMNAVKVRGKGYWMVDVSSLDDVPAMVWHKESAERIARWYAEGNKDALAQPIKVGVDVDGGRSLADGNHRLAVARLVGAKRIAVRLLDYE